ncbi:MAG: hydrogenase maturation nickel metallochaperone HypA [Deltaproteobacteria bacterium]|nr:hydrogenase maturation nickel metallochaperone HypA [Deltaproteobacteria bacterium]
MHEMSIAQSLVDIVRDEMHRNQARVLRSVHLHIGEMSAIVPQALSFCFHVITEGTEMEGARLDMEIVPLRGYCGRCKREFRIENYEFRCPYCKNGDIETLAGQDLSIVEIEVE